MSVVWVSLCKSDLSLNLIMQNSRWQDGCQIKFVWILSLCELFEFVSEFDWIWIILGALLAKRLFFVVFFCSFFLCYIVVWICLHKREIFISHGKWLVACEWPNRLIRNCVSCNWVSCAVCPKTLCLLPIFCILWELSSWKHYIPMDPDIGSILTKIFPHSIHIISPNLTQSLVIKI